MAEETDTSQRESDFIRSQVEAESQEESGNPIGRLLSNLGEEELWFRFRVDKEAFGSKEVFDQVCEILGIDPKSKPIQRREEGENWWSWFVGFLLNERECWWFSQDNKACLWCEKDPRRSNDFYPRYFEFTGLRSRVCRAGDYVLNRGIGDGFNLGPHIVWGNAPWNKKKPETED